MTDRVQTHPFREWRYCEQHDKAYHMASECPYCSGELIVAEGDARRASSNRAATVVTVQRACNGCGRDLRDATKAECEAAISGAPLPDVRSQCPDCSGHATRNREAEDVIGDVFAEYPTPEPIHVVLALREAGFDV